MAPLVLSDIDRREWRGRVATARRFVGRYPTLLVDVDLVIRVGDYLDVVESRLDFLRTQTRQGDR